MKGGEKPAERKILCEEAIELMTMHGEMANAVVLPFIFVVNANADQMRHHLRKAIIVIALYPHDFDVSFRIRQLSDVAEEAPVLFLKPPKIEIGKNIAEQDQPIE